MLFTFVLDDAALYRTPGGPPPHRGPWQVLTSDGWRLSTGPGFEGHVPPDWAIWLVAVRHAGGETEALRALDWTEPPDVPRIRTEDPELVERVREEVEVAWREEGREADLRRIGPGDLWDEVERRLRARRRA